MTLWPSQIALAVHAWLPLGLAALMPLVLFAAFIPLSRRHAAIATVLAMRMVLLLAVGFAMLVAVATVSVVNAGLRELRQHHEEAVRALAQRLHRVSPANIAVRGQLEISRFRANDAAVSLVALGAGGCGTFCVLDIDSTLSPTVVRERLAHVWPAAPGREYAISIDGRPILLVGQPVLDSSGRGQSTVVLGVNAEPLALQAARTAWMLLGISYALLALVGWSSFRQIDRSLGARIQAITAQIRNGSIEEPIQTLKVDGVELRELADCVSTYIIATLAAQKSSDDRHRRLIELAPDGVIMCSKSSIKFVNGAALELTGARSRYDMLGVPIEQFLELELMRSDRAKAGPRPARWKRLDGTILQVEVVEITESEDGGAQYLVRDVTDARNREAVLAHRAEHDSLTGLVNRARFETRLIELLTPGSANSRLGAERQVAVLYIDLDAFKPVNDRYGHAVGDAVLVAVADRLRDATRNSDLLARLGGDEFAVLLEVRDHQEVRNVADRILGSLERPIELEGHSLQVGASIGIADTHVTVAGPPMTAAELLRMADAAMYSAKQSGGNRAAA